MRKSLIRRVGVPASLLFIALGLFTGCGPSVKTVERTLDQGKLARIAEEAKDPNVRCAAVRKLTDPVVLTKIAKGDPDERVCWEALATLNDEDALVKIAQEYDARRLHAAAVARLTNQCLLAHVAMTSWPSQTRLEAVRRITDPFVLMKVIVEDTPGSPLEVAAEDYRLAAATKLSDPALLAELALKSRYSEIRKLVVAKIADQNVLARVAMTDGDADVRRVTLESVTDPRVWVQLVREAKEVDIRKRAAAKITDEAVLADVAARDASEDVCLAAMAGVKDPAWLATIVVTARSIKVRKAAASRLPVRKLENQALWARMVLSHGYRDVRWEALEKITDQQSLAEIIFYSGDQKITREALDKLTNQVLLANVAMTVPDQEVCSTAASRITDRSVLDRVGMWMVPEYTRKVTDQKLLADIALNARDWDVCRAAVETLSDTNLLGQICAIRDDGFPRRMIRPIAAARLFVHATTNQMELANMAAHGHGEYENAAVDKLDDQTLLANVALEAEHADIRVRAIEKLTASATLLQIAMEDKVEEVRLAAAKKISGQVELTRLAEKAGDPMVRATAVEKITDQGQWVRFAVHDKAYAVQVAAVRKLQDQALLASIAGGNQAEGVRIAAIQKLTDPSLLAHFVRNATNEDIRSAAAIRQTVYLDQPALARVAVEHRENFDVCMAAVHAITDPDMLAKVVEELCEKRFYFTKVMNAAVDKIADQGLWARMAVDECCRPIREKIVARLTNQVVLTEIAEKDTAPMVRRAAAERLENPDLKARIMSQLMAQFVAEEVVDARGDRSRAAALLEVDCDPLIRVLAQKEKNTRVRATAIMLLTDQNERKRLAALDPLPMMRQAAVAGVEDDAFLLSRADRDDAIMVRKTAVNAMRDSQTLAQAATMAYDDQVRQWALAILERRSEKDLIARAKAAQELIQERIRAIQATSEKSLVMKAALHGETRMICHAAIARLKDDADLKRVVLESSDPEAAGMAFDEIRAPPIWAEIAENAAINPAVRMIAVVKTGRFSWREILSAAMNDVKALNVAAAAVRWTSTEREAAKDAMGEVCRELLRVGDESRIPELVDLLSLCGEKSLAEDYLNSGHPDLNDAAVDWARGRGYQITPGSGSNRAAWGTR